MERHPVLRAVDEIDQSLKDITDVPVDFLSTTEKREALLAAQKVTAQLESLRLRLLAASADVADDEGCRDVATWLSLRAHRPGKHRAAAAPRPGTRHPLAPGG